MKNDIFRTPIFYGKTEKIADALNLYNAMRRERPSRMVSNRGGYQSPFLTKEEIKRTITAEMMKPIVHKIMKTYQWKGPIEFIVNGAWFNAIESGNYNISHIHSKCHFTCNWYLQIPNSKSGHLILEHTDDIMMMSGLMELKAVKKNSYNSSLMKIVPSTGRLVMFPASIRHRVESYYGKGTRISLSFNGSFKQ
tara:strand:+ start:40 stop:621 length:582 start_codon:yes stop_codon:yes gene_type:complete